MKYAREREKVHFFLENMGLMFVKGEWETCNLKRSFLLPKIFKLKKANFLQ